ncbi:hypothetical protein RDI58_010996 [Solanum bulbocastanum]|uniref:Uncharacterized protein n=1 Tax=Solanum bulbocastanum TaxID=147425 RepID=A0AAN8TQA6_SOLBU
MSSEIQIPNLEDLVEFFATFDYFTMSVGDTAIPLQLLIEDVCFHARLEEDATTADEDYDMDVRRATLACTTKFIYG